MGVSAATLYAFAAHSIYGLVESGEKNAGLNATYQP
jgi:hypothetical protein